MKHIVTMAVILGLGAVGLSAQDTPVNMKVSGTGGASAINLQTGTGTAEYTLAGNGTLGRFTLRVVSSSAASPQASGTCSGTYFPVLAGEGAFRFQDGSLLKLNLTGGGDCIDFVAHKAFCTRVFQIVGGTGRFDGATGDTVTLDMDVSGVVPGKGFLFAVVGDVNGIVSGVDIDNGPQDPH